jgi:hypothetical protein
LYQIDIDCKIFIFNENKNTDSFMEKSIIIVGAGKAGQWTGPYTGTVIAALSG